MDFLQGLPPEKLALLGIGVSAIGWYVAERMGFKLPSKKGRPPKPPLDRENLQFDNAVRTIRKYPGGLSYETRYWNDGTWEHIVEDTSGSSERGLLSAELEQELAEKLEEWIDSARHRNSTDAKPENNG